MTTTIATASNSNHLTMLPKLEPVNIPPTNNRAVSTEVTTSSYCTVNPSQTTCYLCDEQNPGDFTPTTKDLSVCLLCSRSYCRVHSAVQWNNVCNTNHSKYYHDCLTRARNELARRSPDGTARLHEAEELLVEQGVHPSLGEREKAIFQTSPISSDKMTEIENFRKLDAEMRGTKDKKVEVEEVDILDAGFAV